MSIDAQAVIDFDDWLDSKVSRQYLGQPLAQDWARVAKIQEEAGEVIAALIGYTGQNPRKGFTHDQYHILQELADTALTAIYAIQHFTKNIEKTQAVIAERQALHISRMNAHDA